MRFSSDLSRRRFMKGLMSVGISSLSTRLMRPRLSLAQSLGNTGGKNIIIVNFRGGIDGLTLCPYYEGTIADKIRTDMRPSLYVPSSQVLTLFPQTGEPEKIGFHPNLAPLLTASASRVKLIQQYGNPRYDERSHETAQILLGSGQSQITSAGASQGFLARLSDLLEWKSLQYWGIGGSNSLEFRTTKTKPLVIDSLEDLDFAATWNENDEDKEFFVEIEKRLLSRWQPTTPTAAALGSALHSMYESVAIVGSEVRPQVVGKNVAGDFTSTHFGTQVKDASKILKAKETSATLDLQSRALLIHLEMDGFDTHSDQNAPDNEENLPLLINDFAKNMAVLIEDLKSSGAWSRTLFVLVSEFGRCQWQNGSAGKSSVGTDHAWANNTFAFGGMLNGGVLGTPPSLIQLADRQFNALTPTIDVRDIFTDAIEWLGVDASQLFQATDYTKRSAGLFT